MGRGWSESRGGSALSWVVDAGVAAALLTAFWSHHLFGGVGTGLFVAGAGLAVVVAAAVLLRWRFPTASPVVALGATGAGWMLGVSTDPMLALAWCLYPLALRRGGRTKVIGPAAGVVMLLVSVSHGSERLVRVPRRSA